MLDCGRFDFPRGSECPRRVPSAYILAWQDRATYASLSTDTSRITIVGQQVSNDSHSIDRGAFNTRVIERTRFLGEYRRGFESQQGLCYYLNGRSLLVCKSNLMCSFVHLKMATFKRERKLGDSREYESCAKRI